MAFFLFKYFFQKFDGNKNRFHDIYIIIDFNTVNYKLFHCGASSKDSGNKINTISKVEDKDLNCNLIDEILNNNELIIK